MTTLFVVLSIAVAVVLFPPSTLFVEAFATRRAGVAKLLKPVEFVTEKSRNKKLSTYPEIPNDLKDCFSSKEWEQRCQLAVSYRIAYLHGWHENIFNHITLKFEGSEYEADGPHFLLNDFGLGFDEITACNLLKVNLDGTLVEQTNPIPPDRRTINTEKGRVFKPGYVLHSAIHAARYVQYKLFFLQWLLKGGNLRDMVYDVDPNLNWNSLLIPQGRMFTLFGMGTTLIQVQYLKQRLEFFLYHRR